MTDRPLVTNLWFDTQAEEAARFYTGIFSDARLGTVTAVRQPGPAPPTRSSWSSSS